MLTPRQAQITELVGRGLSNKAIASRLGVAVRTVEKHIEKAARQIPGPGPQRYKLIVWFLSIHENEERSA